MATLTPCARCLRRAQTLTGRLIASRPFLAALSSHIGVMRVLLAAGANVEAVRAGGMRPLHVAITFGHVAAATLLLDAGADVNALDNAGRSPLALARAPAMRKLLQGARRRVRRARAA